MCDHVTTHTLRAGNQGHHAFAQRHTHTHTHTHTYTHINVAYAVQVGPAVLWKDTSCKVSRHTSPLCCWSCGRVRKWLKEDRGCVWCHNNCLRQGGLRIRHNAAAESKQNEQNQPNVLFHRQDSTSDHINPLVTSGFDSWRTHARVFACGRSEPAAQTQVGVLPRLMHM